jgi:bifunctional non-homologous end joining protein LigD
VRQQVRGERHLGLLEPSRDLTNAARHQLEDCTVGAIRAQLLRALIQGTGHAVPTLIAKPFHREGLVFEEKVDGYRMVAHKDGAAVKLVSRTGIDHTRRYPHIVAAIRAMSAPTLILDGDIAIYDQELISRFEWLRRRQPPGVATPPLFMAFDCLYHRGQDLRPRPLATRRNVLEDVLDDQDLVLPVRGLADNGLKAWQQVVERGYEGLVAKDPASLYRGGRTLAWLKVKQPKYREGERGWEPKGKP